MITKQHLITLRGEEGTGKDKGHLRPPLAYTADTALSTHHASCVKHFQRIHRNVKPHQSAVKSDIKINVCGDFMRP